jgi:predicted deacetylase
VKIHRKAQPARYLLRFDDLCPTMDAAKWNRYLPILTRYSIKPILAVIPDNRDAEFQVKPPDPSFWQQMRSLQNDGATIGMHGYQHLCHSDGHSLLPLHRNTEFAGAPEAYQRDWIHEGLSILRSHGLKPGIWVAPRHGFDRTTLRILQHEKLDVLSDGFAQSPFRWQGATWIPQQLWAPQTKATGIWTVCIHPQSASDGSVALLESFINKHATQFTSIRQILAENHIPVRSLPDRLFHLRMLSRIYLGKVKQHLRSV